MLDKDERENIETLEDAEYMLQSAREWMGSDDFVRAQLNGAIQRIERVLETLAPRAKRRL